MSLPDPEPGLVIRYSYLWLSDHRRGLEEGDKDRPCAIVLVTRRDGGDANTLVVPVTHHHPEDIDAAVEIPAAVKRHLGLDAERSWIVVSEGNLFIWPGPDLRRVGNRQGTFTYGFLPPRLFAEVKRRYLAFASRANMVSRTE